MTDPSFNEICRMAGLRWKPFTPTCRCCGEVMTHLTGLQLSMEAWEGCEGVCNDCLNLAKSLNRIA